MSPESGSQDPTGAYVREWVPELARLPTKHLHTPWKAPTEALHQAGVVLGQTYPHRVVADLEAARAETVAGLLATRAGALAFNDAGGYDLITLPGGQRTRVFTKQEYRLSADGTRKPPPPPTAGRGAARGGRSGAAGRGRGRGRSGVGSVAAGAAGGGGRDAAGQDIRRFMRAAEGEAISAE